MTQHLFVYGTLMDEDIMRRVSGHHYSGESAVLIHYQRKLVRDEVYPAIFPNENHQVEGKLYTNLTQESVERLDHFEGEMYFRQKIEVLTEDQSTKQAETYVLKPEFYSELDDKEWTFDHFLVSGKQLFLQGYRGFENLEY